MKIRGEHFVFALFVIMGVCAIFGPLLVILGVFDPKPKPRTVETIQRQIAFCESEVDKLKEEKEPALLVTESDKERMRSRGMSEEKIQELEDKAKKSEELYKRGRELLIKRWEDKIKKLRQELEELRSKDQRYNGKSHEKG